jgi:hypothetical protein
MALMLSKTYEALLAAGAPGEKARDAAEKLAAYESHFGSVENQLAIMNGRMTGFDARLAALESKLTVVIWAIGINAAATIAILGVLLHK